MVGVKIAADEKVALEVAYAWATRESALAAKEGVPGSLVLDAVAGLLLYCILGVGVVA